MSYTWTYMRADGRPGSSSAFPTQGEAEAWLGEEYALLLEDGVEVVTLENDGQAVYGPMSLREEQ